MARPRKIKDAQELMDKVNQFIALCDSGDIDKPTDYRLCEYLGVSADTLENWMNETDKYVGYAEAIKKLLLFREHYWLTRADEPKQATFAIFNLKQPKNGGYSDKHEQQADINVNVTLNGAKDPFG